MARQSSRSLPFLTNTNSVVRQLVSLTVAWAMLMSSLPLDAANAAPAPPSAREWKSDVTPGTQPAVQSMPLARAAMAKRARLPRGLAPAAASPSAVSPAARTSTSVSAPEPAADLSAPASAPTTASALTSTPAEAPSVAGVTPNLGAAAVARAASGLAKSGLLLQSGGSPTLAVSVGYADNLRSNPSFPVPWQGSPNILFLGGGPSFDAGAIRLDNLSSSPLTIESVVVDLARPGPTFNLWGNFTIPAQSSAILTQTSEFNFDTSDFPISGCGQTVSASDPRIPTVTVTIGGVGTKFSDTGHILDTGGFDLACQGNESLQWRPIGTTGISNTSSTITLTPTTSIQPVGSAYTATALVTDAGNQPISNVVVNFAVLSGPNAGKTGTGTTDSHGKTTFIYTSALPGTDILQASVTNAAGGSIQSEQVTNTWISSGPCPPPAQPPAPGTPVLVYAGQSAGEFSDPMVLAAELTDGTGNPLNGRALSFAFAGQAFSATTDGNGVATVNIAAAPAPGSVPLIVSFAGEPNFNPAQATATINIDREETVIRYVGKTLLGTAAPQQVMALLTDAVEGNPVPNRTVTFTVGSVAVQAVTNANGIAATTLTLGPDQTSGPAALQISFAGDSFYKPSLSGVPIVVFLSTSFVVWGGNAGGLRLGQDVNFWGHSWANQVTGGNYTANPSFKGLADPVDQIHVCEAAAGSGGPLDDHCWQSKPGQSFPPPLTLPAFIEVIISTAITKQDSEIFGNIAAAAVCQVDPTPRYGPDPGKPGFCKLVAVIEDGGNVFPPRPALLAVQNQPATVLPGQTLTVTATITNNSSAQADAVMVNESFDGVTPATGIQTFPSILNGEVKTADFQVTTPIIPVRQGNESSVAYEQRLAGVDGRLFTSTGNISFTDAVNEPFLPIPVSSFSRLQLPRLTLGVSGPSCVGPGSTVPYKVTVSNIGSADAENVSLVMLLPDGTNTTVPIAVIPTGTSVTRTINFVVPAIAPKQANETDQQYIARLQSIDGTQLTALAKANWQDAIGNNYGAIEQQFISITERVPIVTTVPQGPASVLPGTTEILNFTTQNIGGGNASQVFLQITNPDASLFAVPPFALQGGQATVASSRFTVPVVTAKQAGETDAAYLARLNSIDNSALNFIGQLNWLDASGNNYGPTHTTFASTEVLPVLTIMLAAPPTASAGDKITYTITLTNNGHATATISSLTITLPDNSTQTATPAQSTLAPGASTTATVTFTIPISQSAGTVVATAQVTWQDANQNSYGPVSSAASTQVAGIPPTVLASCLPTSSLSVLLNPDKTVTSYVPNGAWGRGVTGLRFVPVEGSGPTAAISTPNVVNSCSSNSVSGQTVCTANNTDVYLLRSTTLTNTLTSGSTAFTSFSGGSCQNCGVAINPVTNQAVIAMGLSGGAGIQFLDLNANTFAPPIPASNHHVSEDISVDPSRGLVLSPSEDSVYGLFKTDATGTNYFTNPISGGGEFDSSAEDCTTGIALAPAEFTGNIFITDLTQATFPPGAPAGTWTAPGKVQNFPEFNSLAAGASGLAVAPGSHLGIVTGEFGGNAFGVVQLPATSGSGTPSISDWVLAFIPPEPTGAGFAFGLDPHTVTAYVSPSSGKAFGLVADGGPTFLAVIDLQALMTAHRSAPHTVDPAVDLVATGIIRFIATAPILTHISPTSGQQGQQNLSISISALATNFVQGVTTANFGSGITVTSLTVNSPTSATAAINIDPITPVGARNLTMTTGSEVVTLNSAFTVNKGPAILTQATPSSGQQGQNGLSVTITGQSTHFVQGSTSAGFSTGISVTSLTVNSPTSATALVNIDPITSLGVRTVTLTTSGEAASGNIFSVTAGPAKISQVSPNTGPQGQQGLSVTITGQSTHFQQNVTTASFGGGITVVSVTVNSATRATAVLNIPANATLGTRDVNVFTSGETATLTGGFTIVAGIPVITQVNPTSGKQGQLSLSVAVTGAFTHFVQGTTTASFGAGITVSSLTVNSPTNATAVVNIDPAAATGARNVTLTTGAEIASLLGGFTVNPGTPVLTQINPNTGAVGQQNLPVAITGLFTHFVQGSTSVSFGGITVNSVTVNSPTSLTAVISISTGFPTGPRTVTVFDPSETVSLTNGFTVTTTPFLAQVSPNAAQQGTLNLPVALIAQNTHFVQGTTTASFAAGVTVNSLTVNSATTATAVISIDPAATPGARDVTVTTGAEVVTLTGGFTVLPPPPSVSTNLPEGTSITSPTQITGSVTSGSWHLQYALASADGTTTNPVFVTFASGTNAVSNGVLGTLDPTVLLNGNYVILLVSTDAFGQTSTVSSNVNVERNAKVGNFTLSFTDLNVDLSGLPLSVIRTYDSRDKGSHDFGIGWTLSLANVRLQKNGKTGANWEMTQSGGLLPTFCLQETKPHIVTITFPNNTVYKFEATTTPQCQQIVPFEFATVTFTQLPGTTGTPGATLQIVGDNNPLVNPSAVGQVDLLSIDTLEDINPTVFQLTTAEGFTYVIDQALGATSVTDRNGNTLTINTSGITSSLGKSVVFTRDTQGRITRIADPAGNALTYSYTAAGDLASFTDAVGNVTTFAYDPTHLLTNIVDPRGFQAVRNTYDATGRLIATTDANGNTIQVTTDVAAQQEVVRDRLGNPTVLQYDADGNVTRETDALGNTQTSTFDANDNVLTQTDALGKTTSFTYDAVGNRLTETDPLGHTTTYTYNARKQPLTVTDALGHVITTTYDSNGNMLSTTDARGNTTTYTYNTQGLPLTMKDAQGNTTSFVYDSAGHVTQQTDALGNVSNFTYDANGNRLSQAVTRTKADGTKETLTTQYQYDGSNRVIKTTNPDSTSMRVVYNAANKQGDTFDALNRKTHFDYDANGRLNKTTYPDGTIESIAYDANDRQLTSTDRAGRVTSFTYDAVGRQIKITNSDLSFTQTVYDAAGHTTQAIDALGHATSYGYDDSGRRTSITDAAGKVTTFAYDAAGNRTSMTDALSHTTQFAFDAVNRPVQTIHPDATTDSVAYDSLGRVASRTDQAGKVTQFGYDALGRLTSVTQALGATPLVTQYSYDEIGNRIGQTDANGHVTKYAYDQLGRRLSRTLPLGMSEAYGYDAVGNLVSKTDFNGHNTSYLYNAVNRLTQKTADPFFSAGACAGGACGATQVSYTYTATGRRASMTDASGVTSYTYDTRDRVLTKAAPAGTLNYSYDAQGNILTLQSSNAGGASMAYAYDALNRLASVTDTGGTTTYTYDAVGNLTNFAYPNGVQTGYTYNPLNRLTNMQSTCGAGAPGCGAAGTAISSYSYTLGAAGNRLSVAELSGRTVNYAYDDLYRLTTETVAGAATQNGSISYQYDSVGNRLQRNSTVPAIPATGLLSYDANDRTSTDSYDANGNLLASGVGTNVYDFENHLVTAGGVTLAYDGDGNRAQETVAGTTTSYLVADLNLTGYAQVLDELKGGAVSRAYSYGLELINERQSIAGTPTTSFYGYDGHGSVRLLTNTAGAVTDTYDYDAFGNLIAQTGTTPNNYLFAGEQFDPALGIYYNRARYYDQRQGRFWTMDDYEGDPQAPISLHKYLYAGDDPVDRVDRNGRQFSIGDFAISVAISATLEAISAAYIHWDAPSGEFWTQVGLGFLKGAAIGAIGYGLGALTLKLAAPLLKAMFEPLFAAIGNLERITLTGKTGMEALLVRLSRLFLNTNKAYPRVGETFIGRILQKLFPQVEWEMHHIFVQQAFSRAGSAAQVFDDVAANEGLRRIGNGLWNLIPIPGILNNFLGRSAAATGAFAAMYYGAIVYSGYELLATILDED